MLPMQKGVVSTRTVFASMLAMARLEGVSTPQTIDAEFLLLDSRQRSTPSTSDINTQSVLLHRWDRYP